MTSPMDTPPSLLKRAADEAWVKYCKGELPPLWFSRSEHAAWNFLEGYMQALIAAQPASPASLQVRGPRIVRGDGWWSEDGGLSWHHPAPNAAAPLHGNATVVTVRLATPQPSPTGPVERAETPQASPAPSDLHPETSALVDRFAAALKTKLLAAEKKYGYEADWLSDDWLDECREHLREHVEKGDPRDVAAYCAFLWHHGASTSAQDKRAEPQGDPAPSDYVSAFMDGLSWTLANRDSKPGEWRAAAIECAQMRGAHAKGAAPTGPVEAQERTLRHFDHVECKECGNYFHCGRCGALEPEVWLDEKPRRSKSGHPNDPEDADDIAF